LYLKNSVSAAKAICYVHWDPPNDYQDPLMIYWNDTTAELWLVNNSELTYQHESKWCIDFTPVVVFIMLVIGDKSNMASLISIICRTTFTALYTRGLFDVALTVNSFLQCIARLTNTVGVNFIESWSTFTAVYKLSVRKFSFWTRWMLLVNANYSRWLKFSARYLQTWHWSMVMSKIHRCITVCSGSEFMITSIGCHRWPMQ